MLAIIHQRFLNKDDKVISEHTYCHTDVEQIPSVHGNNREFRCRQCGAEWIESVLSPQIMEADQILKYYPKALKCSKL